METLKLYMNTLTAIDKSLLQGQAISVLEFLNGLKGKVFSKSPKDTFVTLSTSWLSEPLTVVYKCEETNSLHLESGFIYEPSYDAGDVVYLDKSSDPNDHVTFEELIQILEDEILDKSIPVVISCSNDEHSYPMTMLFKCSVECHAVHIKSFVKEEIILN